MYYHLKNIDDVTPNQRSNISKGIKPLRKPELILYSIGEPHPRRRYCSLSDIGRTYVEHYILGGKKEEETQRLSELDKLKSWEHSKRIFDNIYANKPYGLSSNLTNQQIYSDMLSTSEDTHPFHSMIWYLPRLELYNNYFSRKASDIRRFAALCTDQPDVNNFLSHLESYSEYWLRYCSIKEEYSILYETMKSCIIEAVHRFGDYVPDPYETRMERIEKNPELLRKYYTDGEIADDIEPFTTEERIIRDFKGLYRILNRFHYKFWDIFFHYFINLGKIFMKAKETEDDEYKKSLDYFWLQHSELCAYDLVELIIAYNKTGGEELILDEETEESVIETIISAMIPIFLQYSLPIAQSYFQFKELVIKTIEFNHQIQELEERVRSGTALKGRCNMCPGPP